MSVVVLILPQGRGCASLQPRTAEALSRLGVTDVTLADGPDGSAVVVSGWALDGRRTEHELVQLVAPDGVESVLHGVADLVLATSASTGREP